MGMIRIAVLGLAAAALAAPPEAFAQSRPAHTYRCVGKDGKKYYGSTIPAQCMGQPVEALSSQGTVLHRIDPDSDEKMRLVREAEAARKREEEQANREESRRNRALLATYTSERDIEDARARALADNAKQVREVEARMEAIKKRQAGYAKEMEFYSEGKAPDKSGKAKPGGGAKPPPKLVEDMRTADVDLKLQEEALAQRKKQVETINAKYDEDKKRFLALTQRK
jgi:hypothetical protein